MTFASFVCVSKCEFVPSEISSSIAQGTVLDKFIFNVFLEMRNVHYALVFCFCLVCIELIANVYIPHAFLDGGKKRKCIHELQNGKNEKIKKKTQGSDEEGGVLSYKMTWKLIKSEYV